MDGLVNECKSEISRLKWKFSIFRIQDILKFPIPVHILQCSQTS